MGNYTIFQMFENLWRSRQARNFITNVPKILDLKSSSDIFRKLTLGATVKTHLCYIVMYFVFKRVINRFILNFVLSSLVLVLLFSCSCLSSLVLVPFPFLAIFSPRQRACSQATPPTKRCCHSGTLRFFLRAAGIFRVGQRPKIRAAEPRVKTLFARGTMMKT